MQKATIFRIIATVGILGTVLYEIVTNTNTLYIKIVQAVFMVILWTALAVDRYQHNKSKRELKKDFARILKIRTALFLGHNPR
ncbi:hypothetical protein Q8A50_08985 [Leuconostoc mesenteroides]|uniref:hypothetical protein n=1 Tax=Leuconostoc mesenteroides TaxID=1245 RepID=UPI00273192C7|nr:hypothetical protein [Leuconostoc mesenteroides]MDP0487685.1 hypothetical protein [Leuconostoc mesenteroides]